MSVKKVAIVGCGMGTDTMTVEALKAVNQAKVIIGARRMVEMFSELNVAKHYLFEAEKIAHIIAICTEDEIAILVSGDTGFYSATAKLQLHLTQYNLEIYPGISSLSYFVAKLGISWQDIALISCHGRNHNLVDTVRRNPLTFALTGGNTSTLLKRLNQSGFGDLQVSFAQNLGTPEEIGHTCSISEASRYTYDNLTVLLVRNPNADNRLRTGITDSCFIRGSVPMTKAEVRSVIMSKLAIKPTASCLDIGCGTGSVSIEMALAAYQGNVTSIDCSEEAVSLTTQNAIAFHVGNITTVCAKVLDVIDTLPPFEVAFVGGSGGDMVEIFDHLLAKNPDIRIVASAIVLETLTETLNAFKKHNLTFEVCQITVAKSRTVSDLHMMMGQNPIYIISRTTETLKEPHQTLGENGRE